MDAETYADLLPWLVFVVINRKSGLGVDWAGGCAAGTGVLLRVWAYWHGRRAPAATLSVGVFSVFCLLALFVPSWDHQLGDSRSLAVLTLCIAAFVSLRFTPLSDAYTAAQVATGVREDAEFYVLNKEITTVWGVGALLVSVAFAGSALYQGAVAFTFLSWVVPLVLAAGTILWVARRWERFGLELEAPAGETDSAVTSFARPRWEQQHDAIIRPLRAQRRENV